jgi:hypothetical protein
MKYLRHLRFVHIPIAILSFWFGAAIADGEMWGFGIAAMFAVGGFPWLIAGIIAMVALRDQNLSLKQRIEVLENERRN